VIPLPVAPSHRPPLRVMSLHAFGYCPRLFYLEEVEEIRVADARVFAGRQLHAELEADEEGEATSLDLSSDELGLYGKVDCLKRRDGSFLPYEHKRGKPDRDPDNKPRTWPSDRLQVVAYALLIEEVLGQPVPEGRVRYHKANVTVRVPIDDEARVDLKAAIEEARRLRESVHRPPVAENDRLCAHCSLAPVCLPEEVRQERQPERDPARLFPPDRDGATVHVVAQGTTVGVSGDQLVIRPREGEAVKRPLAQVEGVILHGFAQISTQALRKCAEQEIAVHWLTVGGWHTGSMTASVGQVQRRIRQYQALTDACCGARAAARTAGARSRTTWAASARSSSASRGVRTATRCAASKGRRRCATSGGCVGCSPPRCRTNCGPTRATAGRPWTASTRC
jgi:CRISP-associated protein Cas1